MDKPLTLRKSVIGGETAPEDYIVIWDCMLIGRITLQRGMPLSRPNISWGIILHRQPQLATHHGLTEAIAEAKDRFKAAWSAFLPLLTAEDINAEREWQTQKRRATQNNDADQTIKNAYPSKVE